MINSGIPHTFNIEATDDEGTSHGNQDFCGPKTYTIVPNGDQPWITITGNVVSIVTANVGLADKREDVRIRVSFSNHPTVTRDIVKSVSFVFLACE